MKRVIISVVLAMMAMVWSVPAGLGQSLAADTSSQCSVGGKADPKANCQQGSGFQTQGCVQIALKILNVDSNCVDNTAGTGGAIINYLRSFLRLLNIAVGLIILMMIVLAGVQYITSTADPAQVKAAKTRLQNAIIALVLYLSMFAILTFLVPGIFT